MNQLQKILGTAVCATAMIMTVSCKTHSHGAKAAKTESAPAVAKSEPAPPPPPPPDKNLIAATITPKGTPTAEALGWHVGSQAYTFNKFSFYEAIDKVKALGLHYIEAYPGQKLSPEKPDVKFDHNMDPALYPEVLARLKAADIKLMNYGVVGLGNDEAENRKVFEFAKKMGIETIVSEPPQDAFTLLDKLTEEYGINVALHNHPQAVPLLESGHGSCGVQGAQQAHRRMRGYRSLDAVRHLAPGSGEEA